MPSFQVCETLLLRDANLKRFETPVEFRALEEDRAEEPTFVEHAAEQDLQLRRCGGSECFTFDGTPRHETFSISSDCADSCFQTVRNYEHGVVSWAPDRFPLTQSAEPGTRESI